MDDDVDALTLARYLSGELNAAAAARVSAWIDADPARRAEAERLQAAWDRLSPADFDPDNALWGRIAGRLDHPPGPVLIRADRRPLRLQTPSRAMSVPGGIRRIVGRRWVLALSAAVLLLALATVLLVRSRADLDDETASTADRDLVTHCAQTAAIQLSDGTRVTLGPDSRLTILARRDRDLAGARDLTLIGEGYFEVHHDAAHPFRVHTTLGVVEDVGTAFAVTAYPETRGMQVVVADGVVNIRGASVKATDRPLATLGPGTLAHLDSAGLVTLTHGAPVGDYVAWTRGQLVFDGTPLRDAIPALERTYDLDIRLGARALGDRHLTATFGNESAARVLELLALALDLRVEHRGTVLVLHPLHMEHAS